MNFNQDYTKIENCNRCCSDKYSFKGDDIVCENCGFSEPFEVWQLRGWRDINKYPPTYSGKIFVYGKKIGRYIARWDSKTKLCDNPDATHWLRTPDPTKQIGM